MKRQASVLLVLGLLVATVAIVVNLAGSSPQRDRTDAVRQQPSPAELAAKPADTSPDLRQVNPYDFLDLIPEGKKAPDFQTKTVDGKTLSLAGLKGKNLVIVFYQGSFCSVCGHQLSNLQKHIDDFKAQNTEIIAVSADDAAHAMKTLGERGLSFNVVPDPNKALIKQFGVQNISKHNIAYPSAYIIDSKGTVRLSFADAAGTRLHSNDLLPRLSKITGKPAPKLTYDQ